MVLYYAWYIHIHFFIFLGAVQIKESINLSHVVKEIESLKLVGDGVEKNSKETSSGSLSFKFNIILDNDHGVFF